MVARILLMFFSVWLALIAPPIIAYIVASILDLSENWRMIFATAGIIFAVFQFNVNMQHLHQFGKILSGDDSELIDVKQLWSVYSLHYRIPRFIGVLVVLFALIATGHAISIFTAFGIDKPLVGISSLAAFVFAVMYEIKVMRSGIIVTKKPDIVLSVRIFELLMIIGVAVVWVAPLQHLYSWTFIKIFGLRYLMWHNYLLVPLLYFVYLFFINMVEFLQNEVLNTR